jgi:sugar phosphate isomerase/epimerase
LRHDPLAHARRHGRNLSVAIFIGRKSICSMNTMIDRRAFIRRGMQGTLALGACSMLPQVQAAAGGMTLGFSTYGMHDLKTEAAIRQLKQIGYDAVELTIWPDWDANPAALSADRRRSIRKVLEDTGIVLSSFMGKFKISNRNADHRSVMDRIRLAGQLGRDLSPGHAPLIQSTLGGKKWEDMKDLYLRQLEDWAKVAEAERTVVAIKPHRGGALSRPSEAAWLIKKLGNPQWLRMCYDYSHYDFRDMTLEDTIAEALPYTSHIAIKEAVKKDGKLMFVNPGRGGRTDFAKLIGLFHAGGYRGDVCCEVSSQVWRQKGYDPIASARQCYKFIAPEFKKAGVSR